MPKGNIGEFALGGNSAHNKRELLKRNKQTLKLAAKCKAAEQRHKAHFLELQSWIKETRPFCLELIRDLRKKVSAKNAIDAFAISKWYKQKVSKALKGCGKHKLSENMHKVLGKRGTIVLMGILMRTPRFRVNKKLIEVEIAKAVTKFNQEMNA